MNRQSEKKLVDLVINWVRVNGRTNGFAEEITGDTNLLESGLLDSLGFVELILFIENQSGWQVDLTDVDPAEFSVVKGLCGIALRNSSGNHSDAVNH